jgi:hypothetical protein
MKYMEYTWSPYGIYGVHKESRWSPGGIYGIYKESRRSPHGVHGYPWGSVTYRTHLPLINRLTPIGERHHNSFSLSPSSPEQGPPTNPRNHPNWSHSTKRCDHSLYNISQWKETQGPHQGGQWSQLPKYT